MTYLIIPSLIGSGVFRQRSSSVEETPSPMVQNISMSPQGPGFERVQSLDHIDGAIPRAGKTY